VKRRFSLSTSRYVTPMEVTIRLVAPTYGR
jgi:hypothetical protein